MKIPRSIWVVVALAVILIGARLVLLHYVTRHVNNVLAGVQGYACKAGDVDLYLYRGGFQLQEVYIAKTEAQHDTPYLYIPILDFSMEWSALLDEAVTSKVTFERAQLNFIESKEGDQYGTGVNWTAVLNELSPLKINRVDIVDGKFTYYDRHTVPATEFILYHWNGAVENLCHVADSTSALPSIAHLTALYSDTTMVNVKMRFNARKAAPDLDVTLTFENIDLRPLNGFFKTYAQKVVEQGEFDLYTNLALLDGKIDGYIKYEATHLKVVNDASAISTSSSETWRSIGVFLASKQEQEKFATRVPLAGTLREAQPAIWTALWQFYLNAFLKGFEQRKREGTIKLNTVTNEDNALTRKMEKQLKKEKRKERRKRKREERRRQKEDS